MPGMANGKQETLPDDEISKILFGNEVYLTKDSNDKLSLNSFFIAPTGFWPRGQNPRRH